MLAIPHKTACIFFAITHISTVTFAAAAALQCSACEAFASELTDRLAAEVPRSDLDVRHRLDAEGKRYGKVLQFATSEIRAVELLEGICEDGFASKFHLVRNDDGQELWEKYITGNARASDAELKEQRRVLKAQCSTILGKFEDELIAWLRKEGDKPSASTLLCETLGRYCQERAGSDEL
jgi:hypothetical protein